jgi:hypothetical protein
MKSIEHYEQLAREARSECRHENADHLKPGEAVRWNGVTIDGYVARCEQLRCLDCGAWLSLGRASAASRDEMRLARLIVDIYRLWEPGTARTEAVDLAADDCARTA